nr:RepB family protein [Klebsiella pneumoniae]
MAAEPQTGRREVSALTDARKTLAYDFFRILRAPLKNPLKDVMIAVCEEEGLTQAQFIERLLERELTERGLLDVKTSHS